MREAAGGGGEEEFDQQPPRGDGGRWYRQANYSIRSSSNTKTNNRNNSMIDDRAMRYWIRRHRLKMRGIGVNATIKGRALE